LLFYPIKNKNAKITSQYGWRKNPFTGLPQYHNAIDISAPVGTEVFSPLSGLVSKTGETKALGKYINITSGDYKFIFGHLSVIKVKTGDSVNKDSLIGLSGNTGKTTGSHIHFAVFYKNQAIDPLSNSPPSPSILPVTLPDAKKTQSVIFIILPLLVLYTIFKRK